MANDSTGDELTKYIFYLSEFHPLLPKYRHNSFPTFAIPKPQLGIMNILSFKQNLLGPDILPDGSLHEARHVLDAELKHHFTNSLELYETFSPDPGVTEFDPSQGNLLGTGQVTIDLAADIRLTLHEVVYYPALVSGTVRMPMVAISLSKLLQTAGCTFEIDRYDNWVIKKRGQFLVFGTKTPARPPDQRWALGPRISEGGSATVPQGLQGAVAMGPTRADERPPGGLRTAVVGPTAQSMNTPVSVGRSSPRATAAAARPAHPSQHTIRSSREAERGFQNIGGMWIAHPTSAPTTPVRGIPSPSNIVAEKVEAGPPKSSQGNSLLPPKNAARSHWSGAAYKSLPRADEKAARAPKPSNSTSGTPVAPKPHASLKVGLWDSMFGLPRTSFDRIQNKRRPPALETHGTSSIQSHVRQAEAVVKAEKGMAKQGARKNGRTAATETVPATVMKQPVKQQAGKNKEVSAKLWQPRSNKAEAAMGSSLPRLKRRRPPSE